jgi:hypothetical protein
MSRHTPHRLRSPPPRWPEPPPQSPQQAQRAGRTSCPYTNDHVVSRVSSRNPSSAVTSPPTPRLPYLLRASTQLRNLLCFLPTDERMRGSPQLTHLPYSRTSSTASPPIIFVLSEHMSMISVSWSSHTSPPPSCVDLSPRREPMSTVERHCLHRSWWTRTSRDAVEEQGVAPVSRSGEDADRCRVRRWRGHTVARTPSASVPFVSGWPARWGLASLV